MSGFLRVSFISIALAWLAVAAMTGVAAAAPRHGFAATVNPLATRAALDAMREGGNAVDGTIAAALTLAVVDSHNSGIGGGLFMLIRDPNGAFHAIDGRETAPRGCRPELYFHDGKPDPALIQRGPLSAAVPGEIAALFEAARLGKLPIATHLRKASEIAANGFVPDRVLLSRRDNWAERMREYPETARIFLQPLGEGRLRQPDLAASLRSMAEQGADWFYRGPFARRTEEWMKAHGGAMTAADFAAYTPKQREPLRTTYRGWEIVGFPPPSSGGVHVAEILNILETFDLRALGDNTAEFYHLAGEAMKLAFADRAYWLGDPKFTPVPRGLLDKTYARRLAAKINRQHATPVPVHGNPPRAKDELFDRHTTHFSVADSDGWSVACTATINNSFGSLVTIPGTGILLNDQMDDFSLPGVTNIFGLIGSDANAVAPGKRPLSSMSPTIVMTNGRPVLVVGAAGGPTIISQVVLAVIRTIDFGLSAEEALSRPRIHHQWRPDMLRVEESVPARVREELQAKGHKLDVVKTFGVAQAVAMGAEGALSGAHDPRVPGGADGF